MNGQPWMLDRWKFTSSDGEVISGHFGGILLKTVAEEGKEVWHNPVMYTKDPDRFSHFEVVSSPLSDLPIDTEGTFEGWGKQINEVPYHMTIGIKHTAEDWRTQPLNPYGDHAIFERITSEDTPQLNDE